MRLTRKKRGSNIAATAQHITLAAVNDRRTDVS
jgi:hypothetical protein